MGLSSCKRCLRGFTTREAADRHFNKKHHDAVKTDRSREWIGSASEILDQTRLQIVEAIFAAFVTVIQDISQRASEAHAGVAVSGSHDHVLMRDLVTAFEYVLLIHARIVKCLRDVTDNLTVDNVAKFALWGQEIPARHLHRLRSAVLKCIDHAMLDIAVSGESGKRNGSFTLTPIEPHFLVAILASNAASQNLRTSTGSGEDIHRMYQAYTDYLGNEIRVRPKKKLFPNIIALEDELLCLQNVINWQLRFYNDLTLVLNPRSFRITTSKRIQQFDTEFEFLSRMIRKLDSRLKRLGQHRMYVGHLHKRLRHAIEVQEESDHGAIWVFTFVTVLFLPL